MEYPKLKRNFSNADICNWEKILGCIPKEKNSYLERQMYIIEKLSRGYFFAQNNTAKSICQNGVSENLNISREVLKQVSKNCYAEKASLCSSGILESVQQKAFTLAKYSSFELLGSDYASERPLSSCSVSDYNIFLGSIGGEVSIWNLKSYERISASQLAQAKIVSCINVLGNITLAASFDGSIHARLHDTDWQVWDRTEQRLNGIYLNPCTPILASTESSGSFSLLDIQQKKTISKTVAHSSGCYYANFHSDGALLGTTSLSGDIKIWDTRCLESIISLDHCNAVSLLFRKSGYEFLYGGSDGILRNFDLRNIIHTGEQCLHTSNIVNIVDTDDALILASHDGRVSIINRLNLSVVKYLEGHNGKVSSCCYSRQTDGLISCGFDKTWKYWNKL